MKDFTFVTLRHTYSLKCFSIIYLFIYTEKYTWLRHLCTVLKKIVENQIDFIN